MSFRLRIAHLSATFPPYHAGAGNTCYRFALEQARRGHSVEVFTAAAAQGEPPPSDGAIVHRLEPLLAIGNAPLIPQIARLRGFDVIHLHYPFIFGVELLLLNRLLRRDAALVAYYKNRLVGDRLRKPLFWAYEQVWPRILTRQADRVLLLSRAHGESVPYLRAAMGRTPERVVEMPNGVDIERFSPGPAGDARAEFGVPEDAVMAVFCATLDRAHHFKRLDLAIEGLRLSDQGDVHLVVAGDGELRAGYERQAADAGLADRVHFAGAVAHDRLPEMLRASDFFLFPTQPPESFGIVLIEAMASGLPVIASDYPGVRAVVDDGENGALTPLGDADAIASAIRRMVELGGDGRRAMGAAGRAKCERTWTWPRLTDLMDEVYRAAIETRRAKRGRG